MTLVLNRSYAGFFFPFPSGFCETYGLNYWEDIDRADTRLVQWVRDHANENGRCNGGLMCVDIPDACTDYEIDNHCGMESITYVINGKIFHHT